MANTVLTIGEQLTAAKLNQLIGLNTVVIERDKQGRVATITDSMTSVVYTFSYNVNGTVNTITDGDNTWTFNYNSKGECTGYTRT